MKEFLGIKRNVTASIICKIFSGVFRNIQHLNELLINYLGLSLCGCVILVHSPFWVLNCQASSSRAGLKIKYRLNHNELHFYSFGKTNHMNYDGVICF